ncbi:MAG: hypothetical protein ACK55Z_35435, partial [bacterium]
RKPPAGERGDPAGPPRGAPQPPVRALRPRTDEGVAATHERPPLHHRERVNVARALVRQRRHAARGELPAPVPRHRRVGDRAARCRAVGVGERADGAGPAGRHH